MKILFRLFALCGLFFLASCNTIPAPTIQLIGRINLSELTPTQQSGLIEVFSGLTALGNQAFASGFTTNGNTSLSYELNARCLGLEIFVASSSIGAVASIVADGKIIWSGTTTKNGTFTGPLNLENVNTLELRTVATTSAKMMWGNPKLICKSSSTDIGITASLPGAPTLGSVFPWGPDIDPKNVITAGFSESMNPSTVTITTTPPLAFTDTFSNIDDTWFRWTPSGPLQAGTQYKVTITGQDLTGTSMTGSWQFTTSPSPGTGDVTPPSIQSVVPWGNTIETNSFISVTFSEAMKFSSVKITTNPTIVFAYTFSNIDDSYWRWTPSTPLAAGTTYTISVVGTDLNGNTLNGSTSWSFTTAAAAAANKAPTVSITNPLVNANLTVGVATTITANAADADGTVSSVEFFSGSTSLGVDTTSPYSVSFTPSTVGAVALTAKATDNLGAITTSAVVSANAVAPVFNPQELGSTSNGTDTVYLFARSTDNNIYSRTFVNQKAQNAWTNLGGTFDGAPTAVYNNGRIDVFAHNNADTSIYQKTFLNGAWGAWTKMGCCTVETVAAAWIGGKLTVFLTATDNTVWFSVFNGSTWPGFTKRNSTLITGGPTIVPWGAGSDYRLYARGRAANDLLEFTSTTGPTSLAGGLADSPVAVTMNGQISVFARGTDNAIWLKKFNGTAWNAWVSLGLTAKTGLAATTRTNAVDVFALDSAGSIKVNTFAQSNWSGWYDMFANGYNLAHLVGTWSAPIAWPTVAIHAALMPTGHIISWASNDNGVSGGANSAGTNGVIDSAPTDPSHYSNIVYITDPTTMTNTLVNNSTTDLFCSGHAQMANGNLMVAGGNLGLYGGAYTGQKTVNIYNPFLKTWSRIMDMAYGRWYPTVTTLPNGEMFIIGGTNTSYSGGIDPNPIVWNGTSYRRLSGITAMSGASYPWDFVTPTGKLLITGAGGSSSNMYLLNTSGTGSSTTIARGDGLGRTYGSSVLYDQGKVLVVGGNSNTALTVDANTDSPVVRNTNPMQFSRTNLNATLLSDGSVAVNGGNTSGALTGGDGTAVKDIEIWNPSTGNWLRGPQQQYDRVYHSTSLLLPDGRLWSSGGGVCGSCGTKNYNAEFYSPKYLYKPDGSGDLVARPNISAVASSLTYNTSLPITMSSNESIAKVALIKLGSVTHAFNMDQRYVPLNFSQNGTTINATAPQNANLAPQGYYMLVVVNASGVPSAARTIQIK